MKWKGRILKMKKKEKKGKIQFGVYALDCEEYHVSDTSKGY